MSINKIKIKPKNRPIFAKKVKCILRENYQKLPKIGGFEKLLKRPEILRQGHKEPCDAMGGLIGPLFVHTKNKNKTQRSTNFSQKVKCILRENCTKSPKSVVFKNF